MPIKRVPLGQLGGTKVVKHKGTEVSKAEKKRRKTALQIKKYAGKGPSDSRFNAHRHAPSATHKENR